MQARIVVLAGDGIGPEVTDEAKKILNVVARKFGHSFEFDHQLMGGCAIDQKGTSLPEETVQASLAADAVLLGAVGGPKWDVPTRPIGPSAACWRSARRSTCLPTCARSSYHAS